MADEVLSLVVYEVDRATLLTSGDLAARTYFEEQPYRLENVSVEPAEGEVAQRPGTVDGYAGRFTYLAGVRD